MARLPFTLEQLRTFLAVARQESMSRAAESLFLTQGAVSQQVGNLESALGLRLLERSGRRVRLTEAGRSIAAVCEAAARAVDTVAETARQLNSLEVGSVHIGASPTAAAHYLPPLLAAFTQQHPQVRIRVVTENNPAVAARVASGVLDCAMLEGPTDHRELVEELYAEDEVVVVASPGHPLASGPFELAALGRHRLLGREPGAVLEAIAVELLGPAYALADKIELGHLDAVRGAALAGLGYAVLPRVAVSHELAEGRLVELPVTPRWRWIRMVRRRPAAGAALEEFWRVARSLAPGPRKPA